MHMPAVQCVRKVQFNEIVTMPKEPAFLKPILCIRYGFLCAHFIASFSCSELLDPKAASSRKVKIKSTKRKYLVIELHLGHIQTAIDRQQMYSYYSRYTDDATELVKLCSLEIT